MQLLISTHSGLYLFKETPTESVLSHWASGYYYGLAVYPDHVVAARRLDPWSSKVSPSAFEKWSHFGHGIETLPIDGNQVVDVHELAVGPHGLYICNLGKNTLEIRDSETYRIKHFLETDYDKLPGGRAINAVFVDGDSFFYNFHNRHDNSYIHEMCHVGDDIVWCLRHHLPTNGAHNLFVDSEWIYYNDSNKGAVCKMDRLAGVTDDWERKGRTLVHVSTIDDTMHTKGLAVINDEIVVGISGKGTLRDRFVSESHLIFLDRESLRIKRSYQLTRNDGGNIGNVNQIVVLPELA